MKNLRNIVGYIGLGLFSATCAERGVETLDDIFIDGGIHGYCGDGESASPIDTYLGVKRDIPCSSTVAGPHRDPDEDTYGILGPFYSLLGANENVVNHTLWEVILQERPVLNYMGGFGLMLFAGLGYRKEEDR